MNYENIDILKLKIRKLSIIFCLIIVWVFVFGEIFSIVLRYLRNDFWHSNQLFLKMSQWVECFNKQNSFEQCFLENKRRFENKNIRDLPTSIWWFNSKINILTFQESQSNFFIYRWNDEIDEKIISKIKLNENNQMEIMKIFDEWFEYTYIFKKLNIWWIENYIVFFIANPNLINDFLVEIFLFSILIWLSWIVIYFLLYYLISYNFKWVFENIKSMEDFVHNAWHELKTPLAVAQSSLQLSKYTKNYELSIDKAIENLKKLNRLIESLLKLSRLDKHIWTEQINLEQIVEELKQNFLEQLTQKKLLLNIIWENFPEIQADKEHLYILLSNLLSNSIKYTNSWWNINLKIWNNYILIEDNWVWIKKENLSKIYDRFFQDTNWLTTNWFWIWLSIVKKICDLYWWKIEVESNIWKWTIFKIIFSK